MEPTLKFKTADLKKIVTALEAEGHETFDFSTGGAITKPEGPAVIWLKFYLPTKEFLMMRDLDSPPYQAPAERIRTTLP